MNEQWEYKEIVRTPFNPDCGTYPMPTDELNDRGMEGWELVAITRVDEVMGSTGARFWYGERYFFKRRKK
jgi:hypothetical protein